MVASLSEVDSTALNVDDSSPINDDSNDMDTLLAMQLDFIKPLTFNVFTFDKLSFKQFYF